MLMEGHLSTLSRLIGKGGIRFFKDIKSFDISLLFGMIVSYWQLYAGGTAMDTICRDILGQSMKING